MAKNYQFTIIWNIGPVDGTVLCSPTYSNICQGEKYEWEMKLLNNKHNKRIQFCLSSINWNFKNKIDPIAASELQMKRHNKDLLEPIINSEYRVGAENVYYFTPIKAFISDLTNKFTENFKIKFSFDLKNNPIKVRKNILMSLKNLQTAGQQSPNNRQQNANNRQQNSNDKLDQSNKKSQPITNKVNVSNNKQVSNENRSHHMETFKKLLDPSNLVSSQMPFEYLPVNNDLKKDISTGQEVYSATGSMKLFPTIMCKEKIEVPHEMFQVESDEENGFLNSEASSISMDNSSASLPDKIETSKDNMFNDYKFPTSELNSKILIDFNNLLLDQKFCDVYLVCQDFRIGAHRAILSARSSYFQSMFDSIENNTTHILHLNFIDPETLMDMLQYIYTGTASNILNNVDTLIVAAANFELVELKEQCEDILMDTISMETAVDIMALVEQCDAPQLEHKITSYIKKNIRQLIKCDHFEVAMKLRPDLMFSLLKKLHD